MAKEPFIEGSKRPDLTIDLESRVGDMTVRQLSEILGRVSSAKIKDAKEKELTLDKDPTKEPKDHKDAKDHKDPKEHKDQKDTKDHKDPKDTKDQKDAKDPKDSKDQKDQADSKQTKGHKDNKASKEQKDHKDETKEHKDIKDRKDVKEGVLEKHPPDLAKPTGEGGPSSSVDTPSGLEDLIRRTTHLEQEVAALKKEGGGS